MSGAGKAFFPRTHSLALSDRGDLVAGVCHRIIVADVRTRKRIVSFRALPNSSNICFSPDGSELAIKNTRGQIVVADPRTGRILRDFRNYDDGEGSNIKYSPCGDFLITPTRDHDIRILNARTGAVEQRWTFPGEFVRSVSHTADRRTWCFVHNIIARSATEPPDSPYLSIWKWPFETHAEIPSGLPSVWKARISPDGIHVALTGNVFDPFSYVYRIIDMNSNILFSGYKKNSLNITWSQDGSLLGIGESGLKERDHQGFEIMELPSMKKIYFFKSEYNYDAIFAKDNSFVIRSANDKAFITPLFAPTSSERQ
jgi:WD40 repeat protein